MLRALALFVVMGISVSAWADPTVGVVVPGNDKVQATTEATVIGWLGKRNMDIAPTPLTKDGVLTLSNCLAIADLACARGVVEARATSDSVLVIVAQASGPKKKRDLQLSAYWITKNRDVVSVQRMCNHCTDTALPTTLDAMMADLVHQVPTMTGKLKVTSTPEGLLAMVDNDAIGVTPIEHDITPGRHRISVSRDGKVIEQRDVTIVAGKTKAIEVVAPPPEAPPPPPPPVIEKRSRVVPAVMIGVGIAAIATGAVLYEEGGPTGASYTYRDYRPAGIGVAAAGGAIAIVGAILMLRGGNSAPAVALAPGHAYVGWTGRF